MKKVLLLIGFIVFALNSDALSLEELKVEGLRNPIGIDVAKPHFSWELKSDDRGCVQSDYHIVVTDASGMPVWDSGVVESASQSGIVYDGTGLLSRSEYKWTVTVTDNKGNKAQYDCCHAFTSQTYIGHFNVECFFCSASPHKQQSKQLLLQSQEQSQ